MSTRWPYILVAAGLLFAEAVADSAAVAGTLNCVPDVQYWRAKSFLESADAQIGRRQYENAANALKLGLDTLTYRIGSSGGFDDTGMNKQIGDMYERKGDFRAATVTRKSILETRLKYSRPLSSVDCRSGSR